MRDRDLVNPQQYPVLRWSCTWWEAVLLVCTCPGCAVQLWKGNPQTAWAVNINRHTNTPQYAPADIPVSAPRKEGLTANRHWSCTAPKWLSQHVNIHTFSQELGFCVQCLFLSWLSVLITWKMVPSDITAWPPIPSPLKIQAQLHVLVETFDKKL